MMEISIELLGDKRPKAKPGCPAIFPELYRELESLKSGHCIKIPVSSRSDARRIQCLVRGYGRSHNLKVRTEQDGLGNVRVWRELA